MADDDLPRGIALTSLSAEFRADPHSPVDHLRATCPVLHDGQLRDYLVTSAELGRQVLQDPSLLVDPRTTDLASTRRLRGENLDKEPSLLHSDGARHKRLRTLMQQAMSRSRLERFRPRVGEIATSLLAGAPRPRFDFIAHVARPLPTIVIAELLGVGAERHEDFKNWSDDIIAATLNPLASPEEKAAGEAAFAALAALITEEVARRRARPDSADDLINAMITAEFEGSRLDDEEIIDQTQLLLIAGNQTTTDLLGTMLKNLLETDDAYQRLVADPGLINNAVEEAIRFEPPIFSTERIAPADIEIAGTTIPKGFMVGVMLTGINHDPAFNPDPHRFDIERQNIRHMSFGGGRHLCLGAPLARLEAQELLGVMTRQLPALRAAGEPAAYSPSPGFRGLEQYWVIAA